MLKKGKLIVLEGADGSGKTTQAKLLTDFLKKKNIPAVLTSFPRYDSAWGKMVRRYLSGEFGQVNQVSPYLASVLYAGDRLLGSMDIKKWLSEGKTVVCDRYMASNVAHQASKLKDTFREKTRSKRASEKLKFIKWLEHLEYTENKIPKPDIVILITIPNSLAQKFMAKRKRDIHEADVKYQKAVANEYMDYAKGKKNWVIVSNVKDGKLRSLEEVSQEIIGSLKRKKFI